MNPDVFDFSLVLDEHDYLRQPSTHSLCLEKSLLMPYSQFLS